MSASVKIYSLLFESLSLNDPNKEEYDEVFLFRDELFEFVQQEIIPFFVNTGAWTPMTEDQRNHWKFKAGYDVHKDASKLPRNFDGFSPGVLIYINDPEIYLGFEVGVYEDTQECFLDCRMNYAYGKLYNFDYKTDALSDYREMLLRELQDRVSVIVGKIKELMEEKRGKDELYSNYSYTTEEMQTLRPFSKEYRP